MKKYLLILLAAMVSCIPENQPPECTIISPVEGTVYTRGETVQVYVEASDEDSDISEVRLYIDNIGVSSRSSFPYVFSFSTEDLDAGQHIIRVEVIDEYGKATETQVNFTIIPILPEVTTLTPTSVSTLSATVGGEIISTGGGTISEAGILWGTDPDDTDGYTKVTVQLNDNSFSLTLDNLDYNTYYIIAFAETEAGIAYGEQVSFTTLLPSDMFLDARDGNGYRWVQIGTQIWMAENLAYLPEMSNPNNYSVSDPSYYVYGYQGFKTEEAKKTENFDLYGVLYNYAAAIDACPAGWHLPTVEEEQQLVTYIGGSSEVEKLVDTGNEFWVNNSGGNNSTGFTALGAGWAKLGADQVFRFEEKGFGTGFWKVDPCDSNSGRPFEIEANGSFILYDSDCTPNYTGYSVRCIKD